MVDCEDNFKTRMLFIVHHVTTAGMKYCKERSS